MTKNISKKLKTLISLGIVTIVTASNIIPVSALSNKNCTNFHTKNIIYICINGVKYKLPINPSAPIKPEFNLSNNNLESINKPNNNCNNSSGSTNKPNNSNNNSGSINKPETDNSNNNSSSINKPETNNNIESTVENFASYQMEIVDLVNIERSKIGLNPLVLDTNISDVATIKSQDMIAKNYFDHNSPTYGSPFDMMSKFGINYKSAGENIASGQRTPKEVMNSWMNSEGHRKNILNPNFTKIGVGIAKKSNNSIYWTQMFIG
ncbi:MAG: CAP domain-containing protein [Romboutsia sp.]